IGTVANASFISPPFFGKAQKVDKVSDTHFIAAKGYTTTCDFDRPHFRIKSKKIDMYPGDKIQARGDTLCFGRVPVFYSPYLKHSLKDPNMIVQLSPGYKKDWGAFLLSAWRYNFTDKVSGRAYLDYRDKMGFASGFGTNYKDTAVGRGDFKFYYTQERPQNFLEDQPGEFERYFARWRHKWDIDNKTSLINEYIKIVDSKRALMGTNYNVLKDYFPREYDMDSQPISYSQLSHLFPQSSANLIFQKRINPWYDSAQLEKLPEANYSLPSLQIGELPLYFEHTSQAAVYSMMHKVPAAENADYQVTRLDTYNKLSLPVKISFIDFTPFTAIRETIYDKDINATSIAPRTVFYTGTEASTKFYRLFDAKTNFLNLNINELRHIITPRISYSYNHDPSIYSSRLKQIDAVDAIGLNNSALFELSNKLQTKRNQQAVDLVNFIASNTYTFHRTDPSTNEKNDGGFLGDYLFRLELLPYSWMNINSDAIFNHKNNNFTNMNYDFNFNFAPERTIGFGQRYQRAGGNELTLGSDWRLTPKWKFHLYERYQMSNVTALRKRWAAQEYGFERDLHCWLVNFTYSIEKEHGRTVWFIFRLKAFPEVAIDFDTNYHAPKPGSN
ncbi:MAG: LPS assembly protein LptD, partial [Candidatus Omnitrophota bacterium]